MKIIMSCVRFAFIGCGAIARLHLKALRDNSHPTQLVAAVDVRRRAAAKLAEMAEPNCKVSGRGLFINIHDGSTIGARSQPAVCAGIQFDRDVSLMG